MNSEQLAAKAERPLAQRPALAGRSAGARAIGVVAAVATSSLLLSSVLALFQPGRQNHTALTEEATFTALLSAPDSAPFKS